MNKSDLYALLDRRADDFREIAGALWDYAEMAFRETKSAALLCDVLEREGLPSNAASRAFTAFTATYGGLPHIGILGEYDALSGLAQTAGSCSGTADRSTRAWLRAQSVGERCARGSGCDQEYLPIIPDA